MESMTSLEELDEESDEPQAPKIVVASTSAANVDSFCINGKTGKVVLPLCLSVRLFSELAAEPYKSLRIGEYR